MKMQTYVIYMLSSMLLISCGTMLKVWPDGFIEEYCEELIEDGTGWDIDFSGDSPED